MGMDALDALAPCALVPHLCSSDAAAAAAAAARFGAPLSPSAPFEVRASHIPHGGLGVFAAVPLARGTNVTFFDGVVRARDDMVARVAAGGAAAASHARTLLHGFAVVDGLRTPLAGRGAASFANDGSATPLLLNAALVPVQTRSGVPVVTLRTTRAVGAGEELLVSYGHDYWRRAAGDAAAAAAAAAGGGGGSSTQCHLAPCATR